MPAAAWEGDVDRAAIMAQLDRVLASALFKNSRRYPNLLRYLVERTLEGNAADLKERTVGIEVFGREPNYDTNVDPVVRTSLAEIRKRLGQYYQDSNHSGELRIDLPLGSYAARFHASLEKPTAILPAPPAAEPEFLRADFVKSSRPSRKTLRLAISIAIGTAILLPFTLRLWPAHTALDRLWNPVLDSARPVLLCVGQRPFVGVSTSEPKASPAQTGAAPPTTLYQLYYLGSQNVALSDVTTLARLTGLLEAKGKPYHVRGESSTTFENLRDGPVVLIGAFNNDWTLRLMGLRRFTFERDGDKFWIKDSQNPSDQSHSVNYATLYLDLTEDFALISRVLDPVTERMVVLAAGLTGYGTMAAGEFLSKPAYMDAIAAHAPANWAHKNVQVLISTKVINGQSGPPQTLVAHFW